MRIMTPFETSDLAGGLLIYLLFGFLSAFRKSFLAPAGEKRESLDFNNSSTPFQKF